MDEELVFGWDDEVEDTGSEFKTMPDGDYYFEVTKLDRTKYNGSDDGKLPPCDEADYALKFIWKDDEGKHTNVLTKRFYLVKSQSWKIFQFFESLGLISKKHDSKISIPWNKAISEVGMCAIGHREYEGKIYNQVNKFYPVEDAPKVAKNDRPDGFTSDDSGDLKFD